MNIIVLSGQTLSDIAIQHYGDIRAVTLLARENGIAVTEDLTAGMTLIAPDVVYDRERAEYCRNNRVVPATAAMEETETRTFTREFSKEFN